MTLASLRAKRNALIAEICEARGRSSGFWDRKIAERQNLDRRIRELTHPGEQSAPRPETPSPRQRNLDPLFHGIIVAVACAAVTALGLGLGFLAAGGW